MANETPVKFILEGVDEASPVIDEVNQKLIESEKRYISKLQEQLIMLERGKDAAEAFKLAEMGFSQATIEQIQAIREKIRVNEQAKAAVEKLKQEEDSLSESTRQTGVNAGKAASAFDQLLGTSGQFGQLANIFESIQQQSDKSASSIQKLAANLTIVATSATAFFAVSKSIVDVLSNQAKAQAEFNFQLAQASRQAEKNRAMLSEYLQDQRQIADLETDRVKQQEMYQQQFEQINQEFLNQQELVDQMQMAVDEAGASTAKWWHDKLGFYQQDYQQAQAILEQNKQQLALLKQQNEEARKKAIGDSEALKAAKERARVEKEHADNQKAAEAEMKRIREEIRNIQDPAGAEARRTAEIAQMEGVTAQQRMELENLQAIRNEERAMSEERQQRLDDLLKTLDENSKKQLEINNAEKNYIEQLQMRKLELQSGKAAVEEHLAREQGVSEEIIKQGRELREQIKIEEDRIKKQEEAKKKAEEDKKKAEKEMASPVQKLQATESRLMTRGSVNPAEVTARRTEELVRLQQSALTVAQTAVRALIAIQANTAEEPEVIGS